MYDFVQLVVNLGRSPNMLMLCQSVFVRTIIMEQLLVTKENDVS